MMDDGEHFRLYGTREREPKPVRLSAGRLAADLINGNLRTITYDGHEVLRGVSYLVRDRDWGTYHPRIDGMEIEQRGDGFRVSYTAHCQGPEQTGLAIRASISASQDGVLVFEAEALSKGGFETNRCGFCILHPIVGLAGAPARVEHVDGTMEETCFPDLIEPWQPFKCMRALSHTIVPGAVAECRMEGDTFEMEDQRNWSDASYKTYVRPLALPWPYRLPVGSPVRQRIVLTIHDDRRHPEASRPLDFKEQPVTISLGTQHGVMPDIGLIVTPEEARATLATPDVLAGIGPQQLLFHFNPAAGHGSKALEDFAAVAALHPGRATLELVLACRQSPATETMEIAGMMRRAGFSPDAILISPLVDGQSTPPGSKWPDCPPLEEVYAAAHDAFPEMRLGGGMLSYFTELNRKRVPSGALSFISHCTNPIVHAADDLSIMQTLEALPFITRSMRAIYGGMPYRIGPSTIAMRQNPYGSRTMDNRHGRRIAMANTDPRHNSLFGEAFSLAYAAQVLSAGLECLTLSAVTGPFGLIVGTGEPAAEGTRRPLFNTIRKLAHAAGCPWQECISSDPSRVLAFATTEDSGSFLHVVNITDQNQRLDLKALAAVQATKDAVFELSPFATARIPFQKCSLGSK